LQTRRFRSLWAKLVRFDSSHRIAFFHIKNASFSSLRNCLRNHLPYAIFLQNSISHITRPTRVQIEYLIEVSSPVVTRQRADVNGSPIPPARITVTNYATESALLAAEFLKKCSETTCVFGSKTGSCMASYRTWLEAIPLSDLLWASGERGI